MLLDASNFPLELKKYPSFIKLVLFLATRGRNHYMWNSAFKPNKTWTNLEVDVSVRQPVGTAFIQEVDIFNEETKERNHNLWGEDHK